MPRIVPDRLALEIAHRMLRATRPLDEMMQVASLKKLLESLARRHMRRRAQFDVKKIQSNDND